MSCWEGLACLNFLFCPDHVVTLQDRQNCVPQRCHGRFHSTIILWGAKQFPASPTATSKKPKQWTLSTDGVQWPWHLGHSRHSSERSFVTHPSARSLLYSLPSPPPWASLIPVFPAVITNHSTSQNCPVYRRHITPTPFLLLRLTAIYL